MNIFLQIFLSFISVFFLNISDRTTILRSSHNTYNIATPTDSTEEVTGKLNILSFAEQNKKVYLVPVNNITLPGKEKIEAELNRIYASAIFQWRVETKPSISVTFPSGKLTHGGSSSVSVYNADQKKVLNTFGAMEENAYYLFFVKDVDYKDRIGEIGGYMPMQYQAGFIYGNPNTATIAHELAHGAFNLEHTFKSYAIPERATANLLDYNNGEELWKYQWKLISNPNHLWLKFLQGEEDAEEIRLANIAALAPLKKNKTYTFFTPDRQCISLPENVQNVYFSTGMNLVTADSTRNETNDFFPLGSLSAFEIGNILYEAINTNTRFDGYYHYPQPGNYKLREKSTLPIAACNEAIALFATKDDEGSTVFGVGLFSKGDSTNACVANFHIPDLTQPVEQPLLKRNIKNDSLLILKGLYYLARTETNANPEIWTSTYKPYDEADFKELSERLTTTLYETQSSGVSALIRDFKTSDKNTEYALDDVTDRLKVFDREVDGTRIIVHIAASKCHIPSDSMPGLAKKIWQESKVSTKNNVIYIVIPCWDERKTSNSLLVKNQTSWDFSIYSNQTNVESFKASDNVVESILNVYKSIPKPYYKIKHFITGSEAGVYLTTTEVEKDENKAGKTCIYDYVLLADKRIDEISSIESAKKWHTINYSVTLNDGYNQSQSEEYLKQQQSFQTDINNFYTQHPDPSYQRIRHGLLESALIDENGKIASVPFQYSDWYLSSIKHVFFISMFDNKMSNDSFVSGRNEAMGEDLLNALDAVGLGLSLVSLDVVTDVISISVAGYYNKPEQSVLYSASTMIPIISGGMTHAAIKGAENLSGVAKGTHTIEKGADGSFVVVKKGSQITEETLQTIKNSLHAKLKGKDNLTKWIDEIENADLLSRLDELDNVYLTKLNVDIAHSKYGTEIKVLVRENPDDLINVWKRLKDDPAYSWELSKEGGSDWERWSHREFFKAVTGKGKMFETETCLKAFKNRQSKEYLQLKNQFQKDFGKNLDDYDMYSQVQLYYSGDNYFVADQVFVKYKTVGGQKMVDDILVLENKLSSTTPLTTPQGGALKNNSYRVRNVEPRKSQFGTSQELKRDDILKFENNQIKWYKVHDGNNGDAISGINKIQ